MTYFKNVETLEELRKQYKELLKKFHPDNANGSTDGAKTDFNSNYWNYEEDKALREILQRIIYFSDITIEICGSWIWISGNTYQYKTELKEIGFKWASTKKQWYWHSESFRKKGKKTLSMDDIRSYYGSTEVRPEERLRLKQA